MPVAPWLAVDRAAVAASVVFTSVLFLSAAADPVNVPKLTALLLCVLVVLGSVTVRGCRTRKVTMPWGLPALAGAVLAGALLVSAVTAPQWTTAWLGAYGRNSGLLAYLCGLILFATVLRAFDAPATRVICWAVMAGGLFTAGYGLLQRIGVDPIAWSNPFNPIIGALGNPDFASAYLGITVPLTAWGALWTGWPTVWRWVSAGLALFCLVVAGLSSAVQGPLAAAAGLGVLALAVVLDLAGSRRRAAGAALGTVIGLGVITMGLGAAHVGPARSFFTGIAYDARTWYWQAAVSMWKRSPLTGVGLDSYGLFWRRDRPVANPRAVGGEAYSDSAHSVPLQHLAQGGLLLAAAYLLFVGVVALALVRGLRRLRGQERLLLAGLGGAWAAYQVQSVVSIDQVPLLVLHFVLAGGVLVASETVTLRRLTLPGALRETPAGKGRKAKAPTSRPWSAADAAVIGGLCVALVVALWLAFTPLRASVAARNGEVALNDGDGTAALAAFAHAVDLEPGIGYYRTRLAATYNLAKRSEDARRTFEESFRRDHAEINALRTAARIAETAGDLETAKRQYGVALSLDPYNSSTILDWATFQLRHSGAKAARERLERAVRELPAVAELWAALGDARAVLDDPAGARAAYERALELKPDEPTATEGLKKLAAASG